LLRFLRRKVDPDLATDLLHEVFVRALGSADADRLANPAAFLRKVAGNLLIDRARRAARHPRRWPWQKPRNPLVHRSRDWRSKQPNCSPCTKPLSNSFHHAPAKFS
jgi:DNA-directed RNA polymerase specialized sigma24 family protein